MVRYLIALFFVLLVSDIANADNFGFEEEETNAFGYADKEVIKVIQNDNIVRDNNIAVKPDCNDKKLVKQAQETLKPYVDHKALSTLDKRHIKLVLKNVDNFLPLEIKDVNASNHRVVAGKVIELKINNHLSDENIKICQSDNPILKDKIYLVMYDYDGKIAVDVINFSNKNIPNFIYEAD